MAKPDSKQSQANTRQTLPKGHFDSDGKSAGKETGAVRPTRDAYQGERKKGESK